MVDRRRAVRHSLSGSLSAAITTVRDAVLESFDGTRASVLTSDPAAPGDELVLLFRPHGAPPIRCVMHVRSSTPACLDNSGAYRLELSITDAAEAPDLA
jgi:hypothetical protein